MPALIATLVALVASAVVAKSVSLVLDDWIWLSTYSFIVPTAIAAVVAMRAKRPGIGDSRYFTRVAVGAVVGSALSFSVVQSLNGYMDLPAWHLFIAIFPVTVVVGATSALIYGLIRFYFTEVKRAAA